MAVANFELFFIKTMNSLACALL